MSDNLRIKGAELVSSHRFKCGRIVPVYEVKTVHSLNQLIGHVKFNNRNYGKVLYRGECKLHSTLKPSLFRNCRKTEKGSSRISRLAKSVHEDPLLCKSLKLEECAQNHRVHLVEGLLQHYGARTRFIDVVDNHWVSLWMGLNRAQTIKSIERYCHYATRAISIGELATASYEGRNSTTTQPEPEEHEIYQYVSLIAVPYPEKQRNGVGESQDFIEVDLRQALPSYFLRPHAQHGLVIRRRPHGEKIRIDADAYDLATSVVGIIKLRIDYVRAWMGTGELLTQENLFPPPLTTMAMTCCLQNRAYSKKRASALRNTYNCQREGRWASIGVSRANHKTSRERQILARYCPDSCANSSRRLPAVGMVTRPAETRPGTFSIPTRCRPRT
ncbi:FRG domain-containing protein [Adlercreutzia muris]|uniref:FRG domain-containing protein n=1 Tax=Adlercreutzia muris TaxID=1796610 RepID=UPI003B968DB1